MESMLSDVATWATKILARLDDERSQLAEIVSDISESASTALDARQSGDVETERSAVADIERYRETTQYRIRLMKDLTKQLSLHAQHIMFCAVMIRLDLEDDD